MGAGDGDPEGVQDLAASLPWSIPTRQQQGRITERKEARRRGARLHPNSGAGRIKHDASTEDQLIEIKDSKVSYTLNKKYLEELWTVATRQGKEPLLVVAFGDLVAEIRLEKR